MANADTVSDILLAAGYCDVDLTRCDVPIRMLGDRAACVDLDRRGDQSGLIEERVSRAR